MKAPIIADNHGDLLVFASVDAAERYLEPIDVLNDEYIAYDSDGRLLRLLVSPDATNIRVEDAETIPSHAKVLRAALVQFLSLVGDDLQQLERLSLGSLVEHALRNHPTV